MKKRRNILPYLLLTPFLLLVILFFLMPVIVTAIMAFTDMNFSMKWNFVGFTNFKRIVEDPNFNQLIWNTVKYVLGTLCINVLFALFLAILTSYFIQNERTSTTYRAIWMLPRISPPIIYIVLWMWLLDPSEMGILNSLRAMFGAEPYFWVGNHAMTIVILVNGLVGASYGMTIFSAAIKSIPVSLFRAAKVDGASDHSVIFDIILPAIKWPIMFVSIWQLLSLLTSYEYILLLTDGGPMIESEVWALHAYHKAFANLEFGYGAALALILVMVALVCTLIMLRLFGFDKMLKSSRID
ncbi:carbohydrate ABC transporter permease [Vallitalea okinawensis]|uniref:carbohydrate ABC transporter permease n=1 Tax=Vallitalea okinawensis TaxID=2078660 RepID=UPI001A9A44E9|nr:sugar ABC transporter permease [Vallitalea okinawensis]